MRLDVRVLALAAAAGALLLGGPASLVAAEPAESAAAGGSGGAKLYRWVDEQGVTHYSDRPRPGAVQVEVPAAQGFRAPPPRRSSVAPVDNGPPEAPLRYNRVEIVRPAADESFVNTGGAPVDVAVALDPALGPGHQIWFFLDGQRLTDVPTAATSTSVSVPRGSHTVAVRIVDANGRTLASSAPVTFHVRQTSIANPPRGPLVRPRT